MVHKNIFVSILGICIYFLYFKHFIIDKIFSKNLILKKSLNSELPYQFTSVFCRGSNHTNRICRFKNLCYEPNSSLFLFFHNNKSVLSGLPNDRFSPTLIDFSSVYDHNAEYFNFVDLPHTALKNYKVSYNKRKYLAFKRFNPENLMHVFHDDILPMFSTLIENYSDEYLVNGVVSLVFADNRAPGPYKDLYENILNQKPIYLNSLSKKYLHCFEDMLIGLNKYSTWYQYGFKEPQGPLKKSLFEVAPIILLFREYFQKKFLINSTINKQCTVILTRKHNRKIVNEEQIKQAVTLMTGFETFTMNLEEYSILEIISKIMQCEILVGIHGSLLILSLFLNKYSIILELFPYGINPSLCTPYKTLASVPGLKLIYQDWENNFKKNSIPHPEYPPELGGIFHLPKDQQHKIKNSVVKHFLCCDDPVWLYKIYQDTVVDLHSFEIALSEAVRKKKFLQLQSEKEDYKLYPSEVEVFYCDIVSEANKTIIKWDSPWNIAFIKVQYLEYEIWIQDTISTEIKAYLTKNNYFHFKNYKSEKMYYVWIRCYADDLIGPFNSSPFSCP